MSGLPYFREWRPIDELAYAWIDNGKVRRGIVAHANRGSILDRFVHCGCIRYKEITKSKDDTKLHWTKGLHCVRITAKGMEVLRDHPMQVAEALAFLGVSHLKIKEILPEEAAKLPEYLTHSEILIRKAAKSKLNQLRR